MKVNVLKEYPLSLNDLAEMLDRSYDWTRLMVNDGGIKHIMIGQSPRFKREWVEEYLARQTVEPKGETND